MKTRTIVCLTVAAVGYGAFLHAAKARGQAEPVAPTALPMEMAMPALPAIPAVPVPLTRPAMPQIPAVPALAAMPEMPAMPAMPDLSSLNPLNDTSIPLGHRHDGPADSCDDL